MGDHKPTPSSEAVPPRMNPEIKALWVAWLRDPAHEQGTGYLRTRNNKYCCLGGLCELARQAGVVRCHIQERVPERYIYVPTREITKEEEMEGTYLATAVLSKVVIDWAGLTATDPSVVYRGRKRSLTVINDVEKLTFEQIAAIIEEQL